MNTAPTIKRSDLDAFASWAAEEIGNGRHAPHGEGEDNGRAIERGLIAMQEITARLKSPTDDLNMLNALAEHVEQKRREVDPLQPDFLKYDEAFNEVLEDLFDVAAMWADDTGRC